MGIADIARILKSDMFVHIFLFIGIVSAVETVIYLLYMKLGFKTLRFSAKVIFISSLLELTVLIIRRFTYGILTLKNRALKFQRHITAAKTAFMTNRIIL